MTKDSIHIIGGGIVGLCSAWYLHQEGYKVSVIDKSNLSDGTSHGNAGMVVPSHFIPMASPGVIAQGLKWLLNSKSPFYIKPKFESDLLTWLWKFYRSANRDKVETSMPVLFAFNEWSKQLYKELSQLSNFDFAFEEKGLLMLYNTPKQAEEEEELAEEAHRLGIKADILNKIELKNLEPEMDLDVLGGIYFPGDAHLYPNRFIEKMIRALKKGGVDFITDKTIIDFKYKNGQITELVDAQKNNISVENVLLASGSWTGQLLKKIGVKIHLQAGKGYSVTLKEPALRPRIPTILSEAKVAITPMGNDLRIGGTLELGGITDTINQNRLAGILESIPAYYNNLEIPNANKLEVWKGYRPCTPDGMPYIGQTKKLKNLIVATGHGMMGLSLGPATGKLVSQIATGQKTNIDTKLFEIDRF
jgi:D-amino-acid dehydrogenase